MRAGVDFGSSFLDFSYTISNNSSEYSMYNPETETRALLNSEKSLFTIYLRIQILKLNKGVL